MNSGFLKWSSVGRALVMALAGGSMLGSNRAAEPANTSPELPPVVDLRPVFTEWGLPVRPQGHRGTCSVFTMVGALEYAHASRQSNGVPLSVEFLNWASNDAARNDRDGGFFSDLWKGFATHGLCRESDLPYRRDYDAGFRPEETTRIQARGFDPANYRLHWIKRWDVKSGLSAEQLREIKFTLARRWPVCGGFRWPKEERWLAGVLEMRPPEGVFDGHSVLLVGYRDDAAQPGGGVFRIRNSGRPGVDQSLSYEYVLAYMNDAAWVEPLAQAGRTR